MKTNPWPLRFIANVFINGVGCWVWCAGKTFDEEAESVGSAEEKLHCVGFMRFA